MVRKSINILLIFLLSAVLSLSAIAADIVAESGEQQVRVPLVVDLSDDIAGAQFAFSYTDGLSFADYEPSGAVESAGVTPAVEKDGVTYLGFFSGANDFAPQNGKLDMGYLVFDYTGDEPQGVTISEIKLVVLTEDNSSTKDEILGPITVSVSRVGGPAPSASPSASPRTNPGANPGASNSPAVGGNNDGGNNDGGNGTWWIIVVAVIVVVAVVIMVVARKKGKGGQQTDKPGDSTPPDA